MRLSDLVRPGEEPKPSREADKTVRTASDLVRAAPQPAPPGPETSPREGEAARAPGREAPPSSSRTAALAREAGTGERLDRRLDATELVFRKAVERIRQALATRAEAPLSMAQAEDAVEMLLQSLETGDALLIPFFRGGDFATNPSRAAVNVCILALKMGLELSFARGELRELGLASLFSDIGTALVPPEMLGTPNALTDDERTVLQGHQREGANLLEKVAPNYGWLADVIRKRYEKPDGPHHPENRVEEYAAIIHLAEMYKSLVHPRSPRKRMGPVEALKEILQHHRAVFPDRILKALIRAMSAYPVGSLVRLNTGEIGRVIDRNRDYPLRPVVDIVVRRGERLPEPVRVDLTQTPLLHIKDSVAEEELP